ncbi:hypothetical protein TKK_0017908 [Trichogramma kaykai]
MDESFDIYADLPSIPLVEVSNDAEIQKKIDEVKSQLEKEKILLEAKYEKLVKDNKQLEISYSSLLKTSRAEIARKDRTIADLRAQLDNMAFRRNERRIPYRNNPPENNYNNNFVGSHQEYRQFNRHSLHTKTPAAISVKVEPSPIDQTRGNLPIPATITAQSKELISSNEYVDQGKLPQTNENSDVDKDYELNHDNEPGDESDDGIINKPVYVSTLYGERLRKKLKEEEQRENEAKMVQQIKNEETKANNIINSEVKNSNQTHLDNIDQKNSKEKIIHSSNVKNDKTVVAPNVCEKVLSDQITQPKSIVIDKVNNKENLSIHNRQQHADNSDSYNSQRNKPKVNEIHSSEEKLSSKVENINKNFTDNIKTSTSSTSSLENPQRIHEEDKIASVSSTSNALKHEEKLSGQNNERLHDSISKNYRNSQNHTDSGHYCTERHRHTESRDREEGHKKHDKRNRHDRSERHRISHRRRSRSRSRSRSKSRSRKHRNHVHSSRHDSERKHKKDKIRTPKKDRIRTPKKYKNKTPKKNRIKSPKKENRKEKSPHKSSHKDSSNVNNEKKETLKRKAEDIIDDNSKRKKTELRPPVEKISACKNFQVTGTNVSQNLMEIEPCPKIMSIVTTNNHEINKQTLNSELGHKKLALTQKNNLEKELEDRELEEGEINDSIDSPFLLKLSDDEDEIKNNANDAVSVQNDKINEKEKVEDTSKNSVDEDKFKINRDKVQDVKININEKKLELENLTKNLNKEKREIENQITGLINNEIIVNERKSDQEKSTEVSNSRLIENKGIEKTESQQPLLNVLPQEMKKPVVKTAELNQKICVNASDNKNNSSIKKENITSSSAIVEGQKNCNSKINNTIVTPLKVEQIRTTHLVTDAYKIFRKTPVKYEVGGLVKKVTPMKTIESVTNEIRSILSSVNSTEEKVQNACTNTVKRTESTNLEKNKVCEKILAAKKTMEIKVSNIKKEKSDKPTDPADLLSVTISNKDSAHQSKKQNAEITKKSIKSEKKTEIKLNQLSVKQEKLCDLSEKLIEKNSNETSLTSDENCEVSKLNEHLENNTEGSMLHQLLMNKNIKNYPYARNCSKINDNNLKSSAECTLGNSQNNTLGTKSTDSNLNNKTVAKKGSKKSMKVEKINSNSSGTCSVANAANLQDKEQNQKSTEEKVSNNQNLPAVTSNPPRNNILANAVIDPSKKLAYLNGKKIILIPRRRRPVQLADSPPVRVVAKK